MVFLELVLLILGMKKEGLIINLRERSLGKKLTHGCFFDLVDDQKHNSTLSGGFHH